MEIQIQKLQNALTFKEKYFNYVTSPRDNEAKHVGSKEDIATRIEADTKVKIEAMNRSLDANKDKVGQIAVVEKNGLNE